MLANSLGNLRSLALLGVPIVLVVGLLVGGLLAYVVYRVTENRARARQVLGAVVAVAVVVSVGLTIWSFS